VYPRAAASAAARCPHSIDELDTNVVSELRRLRLDRAAIGWVSAIPASQLFLSAVTLGGLQAGLEITRQQDRTKPEGIEAWVDMVAATGAVLPADGSVFRRWAKLMHRQPDHLIEDAMIAATALEHDFTVVTRNVQDFERFGTRVLNPLRPA
jgi:toxin FitB